MREYLLRGGFFMADDFHGAFEWDVFEKGIRKAFPDREIRDIPDDDPILHTVYDIKERDSDSRDGPPAGGITSGRNSPTGPEDGKGAHWRGIYDDHGRIMVAISYNSDIGDAWEYADHSSYPMPYADLAMRLGVDYILYAMTR